MVVCELLKIADGLVMPKLERYSWSEMFENTDKIMVQMRALDLQSDRILDGRSKGIASEKIWRKRLLEIVHETELEPLVKEVISESRDWPWMLSEFVTKQFQAISKVIPSSEVDIPELTNLTSDVQKILENKLPRKEELKIVADLGSLYFNAVKKMLSWFERNIPDQLRQEGAARRPRSIVPRSVISRFKQVQILAYVLGYVGVRFVSYDYPTVKRKQKKWCRICFRRNAPNGSEYCEFHNTSNDNKSVFRLGKKIHLALLEDTQKISNWRNFRKSILETENEERVESDIVNLRPTDWKQLLIDLVNRNSCLGKRVSVDYIRTIDSWIDAVEYLRECFNNYQEKTYDCNAVFCWLHMANDFLEIQDMYISPDGKILKSSRSPISRIPTVYLIATQCEQEPGIKKAEIARRLDMTESAVGQCIRDNKELQKYFD